jgi:hypothetical protein
VTVRLTIALNAYSSNDVFEKTEVLLLKASSEIHEIEKLRLVKTKKKSLFAITQECTILF